ncbi:hypothetical protein P8452_25554 [Trifolium repens]|nr:hypothetical protein P8452_25554 [Trifolium repens]
MVNLFQILFPKARETISTIGGEDTTKVDRLDIISCRARQVKWSQYRPAINIFARLLVHRHNKKENANLKFVKVVDAYYRSCGSMGYCITLNANDGEKVNVYETDISILEQAWIDLKELCEFKLVGDVPSVDSGKRNCDMSPN